MTTASYDDGCILQREEGGPDELVGAVGIHGGGSFRSEEVDIINVPSSRLQPLIIPWRNHYAGGGGEVAVLMPSLLTVENDNGRAFKISDGAEDDCHNEPPISSDGNDVSSLLLSHLDHLSMASRVVSLWFLSNYSYTVSLRWTSISSSTVLSSMGSIFAFGFATCTQYGDERVTRWKVVGVTLCGGVIPIVGGRDLSVPGPFARGWRRRRNRDDDDYSSNKNQLF
jgi:hypothetical protein